MAIGVDSPCDGAQELFGHLSLQLEPVQQGDVGVVGDDVFSVVVPAEVVVQVLSPRALVVQVSFAWLLTLTKVVRINVVSKTINDFI